MAIGADVQNGGNWSISDLLNQIMGSTSNVVQPNYPAGSFDATPFKQFYDQAYTQLAPYYTQLLKEAGGDLNTALTNLETDYKTGKRITAEDFTNSMSQLGVTLPKEQTALQGSLNQRGMALTENPQGQTQYAGGGEAAREVGMLNTDQKLRQEAVQRTQQRGNESLAQQKLVGSGSSQQNYRNTTEAQQAQHESAATTLGGQFQYADQAAKQAGIAKAQMDAQTGGSSGGNSWSDILKNTYPGWGETEAKADYKAKNPSEKLF